MASAFDWSRFQEQLSGRVILSGDADFEARSRTFVARFDSIAPQAIAAVRSPLDCAAAIAFARRHELALAIRSGGHSAAGFSSTQGLLVDLSGLSAIAVKDGVVTVGAGVRTGALCERLAEENLVIPVGTCPTVAIGGLTLGGGFGMLGRMYGLTLDHLLGAEIVLADGRVLYCDERSNPDLFWALRGAGAGNFGVVTSLAFSPRLIPQLTVFELSWAAAEAEALIDAWQAFAPTAPGTLNAELALNAESATASIELKGVFAGGDTQARSVMDTFVAHLGRDPAAAFVRQLPYREVLARQADSSVSHEPHALPGVVARQGYRVSKSEFFEDPLPADAIAALAAYWLEGVAEGEARSLEFTPWAGAYSHREPHSTAFVHRTPLFLLQHLALVDADAAPAAKRAAHAWVARSWACVHPHASGRVYPNFPDPDLYDWGSAYFGENLSRLVDVKRRYDPEDVFRYAQSIPRD